MHHFLYVVHDYFHSTSAELSSHKSDPMALKTEAMHSLAQPENPVFYDAYSPCWQVTVAAWDRHTRVESVVSRFEIERISSVGVQVVTVEAHGEGMRNLKL